ELRRLPVGALAAPDSVCVLWSTQTHLPQSLALLKAWGFRFKTAGAWAKRTATNSGRQFGTGYIFRSACEFYLLGTKGKPKQAVRDVRNLIIAAVREHSRKPDQLHQDLERMFPNARKCELFARRHVVGWDCWGDELPAEVGGFSHAH